MRNIANEKWEFRPNGSDNGLDACFCIVGETREYGRIDIEHPDNVAAVCALPDLIAAAEQALSALTPWRNNEEYEAHVALQKAIAKARGEA